LVQCRLKGIFCYRHDTEEIGALLKTLGEQVLSGMTISGEESTLVVVGTRSRAEDFPDGFFKPYWWDEQVEQFRLLY